MISHLSFQHTQDQNSAAVGYYFFARLLAEGTHLRSYRVLGAHILTLDGVAGVSFAVWAPNAGRVAVVGDFNEWD